MPNRRRRLAIFSPVSPQHSGIADYTETNLRLIQDQFDCSLILDGYEPEPDCLPDSVEIVQLADFLTSDFRSIYDCGVYHIGNSPLHNYMFPVLFAWPGVLMLHDFWIMGTRFNHAITAWQGDAFRQEMKMAYGGERGETAAEIILSGLHHSSFLRHFSMAELPVQASRMTLVHNRWLQNYFEQRLPEAAIRVVPHCIEPSIECSAALRSKGRRRINAGENTFVVGMFGGVVPEKRPDVCLRAFAWLKRHVPDALLLITGAEGHDVELDELIRSQNLEKSVIRTGRVPDEDFLTLMQACDCQLFMRWPTNRESSHVLLTSFFYRVPAVITNLAHYSDFPEDAVLRVDLQSEELQLRNHLWQLANDPALRKRLATAGRRYLQQHCDAETVRKYWCAHLEEAITGNPVVPIPQDELPGHLRLETLV